MTKDQILRGLICHSKLSTESDEKYESCITCPYTGCDNCTVKLSIDTLAMIADSNCHPNFIHVYNHLLNINNIEEVRHDYIESSITFYFRDDKPPLTQIFTCPETAEDVFSFVVSQICRKDSLNND